MSESELNAVTLDSDFLDDKVSLEYKPQLTPYEEMLKLLGDMSSHQSAIIRLYKRITKQLRPVKPSTRGFSINDIFKEATNEYENFYSTDWIDRCRVIPIFLDACYMLYIRQRSDAPFYKLPTIYLKFKLINQMLPGPRADVTECFRQIYDNSFIADIRRENPPFHLRTDMLPDEIQQKINELAPLFKNLVECLLKINKQPPQLPEYTIDVKPGSQFIPLKTELVRQVTP